MNRYIVDDWKRVVWSYSLWSFVILFLIAVLPDLIYVQTGVDTNPIVWGWGLVIFAALGAIGRLVKQTPEGAWFRRAVILAGLGITTTLSVARLDASAETQGFGEAHLESPRLSTPDGNHAALTGGERAPAAAASRGRDASKPRADRSTKSHPLG